MFFVLSKMFNFITSPINWLIAIGILFFLLESKKWKRATAIIWLIVFIVFTNGRLCSHAISAWSAEYNISFDSNNTYEIAIVAGGSVGYSEDWKQFNYNERADRMLEAIRLYRKGNIRRLYLSGESAFNDIRGISYAPLFLQYMEEMGVNRKDIILEKQARTTAENIKYLQELLPDVADEEILLITSGWHMRRTLKGFQKTGLNPVPYAVDVPTPFPALQWQDFLPSWHAAQNWQKLIHEMVGMLVI